MDNLVSPIVEAVKTAALKAVEASSPMGAFAAEVIAADPLEVRIDQKLTLNEEHLLMCAKVLETPFEQGELLLLLREQGGQRYIAVDRL